MANNVNVTNRGFEYICQWMMNTVATTVPYTYWTTPTYVGWGGANNMNTSASGVLAPATAPSTTIGTGQWSDVGPFQEFSESRVAGTVSVTNNTTGTTGPLGTFNGTITSQVVGTITAGSGETVQESFLAFSSTKPSAFTLSGAVSSTSATSFTVTASGMTAGGFYQFANEVIYVSSTAASEVITIARGMNGSTPNTAGTGLIITNGNPPGYGPSNPNHGDMFAHAGFVGLALNSGDSIQFTWEINVTS